MLLLPGSRARRAPAVAFSLVICLVWLYILDRTLYGGSFSSAGYRSVLEHVGYSSSSASYFASLTDDLRLTIANVSDPTDFASKGDRVANLSALASQMAADPHQDLAGLVELLRQEYPWFEPRPAMWAPWNASVSAGGNASGPANASDSTGIVICAGSKSFLYAAHLIGTLRNVLHSSLPIEVFYTGDEDLPPTQRAQLVGLGPHIETVDLLDFFDDAKAGLRGNGFGQKPFAMLASRFQRVILADADIIFMRRPDDVFDETPGLIETGTLFWHDRAQPRREKEDARDWLAGLLRGRAPSAMLQQSLFWEFDLTGEMESGVVCMDKARIPVFMSLMFTAWMNIDQGGRPQAWGHTYGDKETFWMAAELSQTPYYFEADYAGNIGYMDVDSDGRERICGTKVAHTDARRRPFWFNGSMRLSKEYGGREMAQLGHWVTGGVDWPGPPYWDYKESGQWCLRGMTAIDLSQTRYQTVLDGIFAEARRLDQQFPNDPPGVGEPAKEAEAAPGASEAVQATSEPAEVSESLEISESAEAIQHAQDSQASQGAEDPQTAQESWQDAQNAPVDGSGQR